MLTKSCSPNQQHNHNIPVSSGPSVSLLCRNTEIYFIKLHKIVSKPKYLHLLNHLFFFTGFQDKKWKICYCLSQTFLKIVYFVEQALKLMNVHASCILFNIEIFRAIQLYLNCTVRHRHTSYKAPSYIWMLPFNSW